MKKFSIAFIFIALAFIMIGCKEEEDFVATMPDVEVYSAPNTVRIMRDEVYQEKGAPRLDFEMAKNEYEGAQLIIKPGFDTTFNAVIEEDLVSSSGARIFKSNVMVYAQHYVEVLIPTTSFDLGFYPDAIVPMEKYLAARDNKISAGENQGLYVTVYTNPNTQAGTYTGRLKLVVGNQYVYIPINVTVWDFTLPVATNSKSAFAIWSNQLFSGELNDSEEMIKIYYEFLLDRRVAPTDLPSIQTADIDAYIEVVKEYTLREDVPSFRLFYESAFREDLNGWVLDVGHFERLMRALIENSTAELNLLEKAYIYVEAIDEPRNNSDYARVKYVNDSIYETIDALAAEYSAKDFFNDKPELLKSLMTFQHVVTTKYKPDLEDAVHTFCAQVNEFNNEKYLLDSLNLQENGHGMWWYTCISPKFPYPSYHIDDYLISSRALSWMQKKYNIEGNLYWSTTIYLKYLNGAYVERDIWNDPLAFPGANGDGFLVYPGRKYGIDGPISTLRLESIREGAEDYEYLYLLEQLLDEANHKYGSNIALNDYINNIYDMLFTGTISNNNSENLLFARREIADLILQLTNDDAPLIITDGINGATGKATISVFAPVDSTVVVNGKSVSSGIKSGSGIKYTTTVELTENFNYAKVEITKDNKTTSYKKYLSSKIENIYSFNLEEDLANINASKFGATEDTKVFLNTDLQYVYEGLGSLRIEVTPAGNSSYLRKIAIDTSQNGQYLNLSKAENICFNVYNQSDKDLTMYLKVTDKNGMSYSVDNFYLQQNSWGEFSISIMLIEGVDFENIANIELVFPEINASKGFLEPINIYFDNLYFNYQDKE